jgi:hypothetical protein
VVSFETVPERKIEITTPLILAYLDLLADLGIYGDTAGRAASFILRREIMRLIETNVLKPIPTKLLKAKADNQDDTDS